MKEDLKGVFYLNDTVLGNGTVEIEVEKDTAKKYQSFKNIGTVFLEGSLCFSKKELYKVIFPKELRKNYNKLIHAKTKRQRKKQYKKYLLYGE